MITISDGKLTIPDDERFVGFSGDNLHIQKKFFIRNTPESGWLYRLYLTFEDGSHNFFTLPATVSSEGTFLIWNVEEGHIFKSGYVKAQIKAFSNDNEVYHTTSDVFVAGKITEEDEEFKNSNSEFLHFEKTLNDLYLKMTDASAKMPYVGTNGNWFTYDISSETYVDSGIPSSVALDNAVIPPEKLDRAYWEKIVPVDKQIFFAEDLFETVGFANTGGSIALVNVDMNVNVGEKEVELVNINGFCYAVGLKFDSGDTVYLINVTDGSQWKINRYNEGDEIVPVYSYKYIRQTGIADGSVTPSMLDREYFKKCRTALGETITSFAELFLKVGFISLSGTIGVVKLWVSDSDNTTIKDDGYIDGEFLAVGSPTHTSGDIYLRNLASGEHWTVTHNYDDDTYYAYKVDALTPRIEHLEKNAKLTCAGTFSNIGDMQKYSFSKDRLYHFYADAQAGNLLGGNGYCYGRYYESDNKKILEVFNSSTLKTFALNITDETSEQLTVSTDAESWNYIRKEIATFADLDKAIDEVTNSTAVKAQKTLLRLKVSVNSELSGIIGAGLYSCLVDIEYIDETPIAFLTNSETGEIWRYASCSEKIEKTNTDSPIIWINNGFHTVDEIKEYEFNESYLYLFSIPQRDTGIDRNICLGVYRATDPTDSEKRLPRLEFTNLLNGKGGVLDLTSYEYAETETLSNKLNTFLLSGKGNTVLDEELKNYTGDNYIGFVVPQDAASYVVMNQYNAHEGDNVQTQLFDDASYTRWLPNGGSWSDWAKVSDRIVDEGGYFESSDVEGALQEIGKRLESVELVSWKSVQDIVRAGRAAEIFSVGDKFVCEHEEYGLLEWMVIGIDHDTPTDKSLTHSMTLRLETPFPGGQFDGEEALFSFNSYLGANTPYTFTANSTTLNFKPTVSVPAGAVAVFPYYNYSSDITQTPLYIYATPADTEPLLTLSVEKGASGPSINAAYNDANRARYGSGNWANSAIRQFLNSSASAGEVWTPKTEFDRPPKWANDTAGFLKGMDEDFLSVIGEVKKETLVVAFDNGENAAIESTEKFFLLSPVEVYAGDYRTGEIPDGKPYDYYKNNSSNSSATINSDTNRIVYYNGSAARAFLRSPLHSKKEEVCYINASGNVNSADACEDFDSNRIVTMPCCCIV